MRDEREDDRRPIDIFITTHNRLAVFRTVLASIHDRTKHPHHVHVFDNGSTQPGMREFLLDALGMGRLQSLHLRPDNTYTLYPKVVFHAMVETTSKYYVVTDSDIEAPDLGEKCWLTRLVEIMDKSLGLGILAAQVPPVWLQRPYRQDASVVYCHAVGNTFKIVRRGVVIFPRQAKDEFGDDTLLCEEIAKKKWTVGYARHVFAHNLGQKENWGYERKEHYSSDPRKMDEPPPLYVPPVDPKTFVTSTRDQYIPGQQFQYDPPPEFAHETSSPTPEAAAASPVGSEER